MNLRQLNVKWEFYKVLKNNQNGKIIEFRDFITFLIWSIVTIFYTIVDPTWIYASANTPLIVIFTTKSRGITFYCKLVKQNMLSFMNRLLISNSKIICLVSDILNWQSKYLSRTCSNFLDSGIQEYCLMLEQKYF